MIDQETLPVSDDAQNQGPSEQELLDAVMANSPIMEEVGVPLPEEEEIAEDPEESEVEDPEESEEAVSEEEEEVEESEEEDTDEDAAEAATQDADVFTADDLDLDAKVAVKIDGEEMEVSFGDLIKGYQTDAHLSKKGREFGEAQKQFEEERNAQLAEVQQLADANIAMLGAAEQGKAKEYGEIEKQIEKARADGDTYEVNELKDKREQIQKEYWNARRQREGLVKAVNEQKQKVAEEQWQKDMQAFSEKIPELIPDFDEKMATDIRDFALEQGLSSEVLDSILDPHVVWMLNDYRQLKQGVQKGAAKRKAVPAKKAVPTKKAKPATKKAEDAAKMRKARAFREDATKDDHDAWLRDFASKSLSNI